MPAWQGKTGSDRRGKRGEAREAATSPQQDVIAGLDYVKANLRHPGVAIVDSRDPEYYKGEKPSNGHTGHIPGAGSLTFSTVVDEKGS